MEGIERLIIDVLLRLTGVDQINSVLSNPATVAIVVGAMVAVATALLGVFLVLRGMSLTADAISHTVLLGIVVAFLVMFALGAVPDLSSPWLILGAAAAGVGTVVLTEWVQRSGLVKADAALGLVFPLMFAIAVILINRYAENVHLDNDAVLFGEIGAAWANTNSHCFEQCEPVTITEEDPRAEVARRCTNCAPGGITPRSPQAVFETICDNCGTFSAGEAWAARLIPEPPVLVFWPRALTVVGLALLANLVFTLLFYKELKIATFDAALARSLGLRPGLMHYALMTLVSVTAVAAFDAVGSILVIAFFIIPAATAYLLTDRLGVMLVLAPLNGVLAAFLGYEIARVWDTSISAAMVIACFGGFLAAWIISPRYGLIATVIRRRLQQLSFADQLLMGHVLHHMEKPEAENELSTATIHEHLKWSTARMRRTLARLRALNLVQVNDGIVLLTDRGVRSVKAFFGETFPATAQPV